VVVHVVQEVQQIVVDVVDEAVDMTPQTVAINIAVLRV
jgi:hypothetical protein